MTRSEFDKVFLMGRLSTITECQEFTTLVNDIAEDNPTIPKDKVMIDLSMMHLVHSLAEVAPDLEKETDYLRDREIAWDLYQQSTQA